jgi:hypothetical protein|eukprot:COSAG02_NODE_11795_length_1653_cov_1.476190_1_plen_42_part_00
MLQKRSLAQQFVVEDLCGVNGERAPAWPAKDHASNLRLVGE